MSTYKRKNKVVEFILGESPSDEIDYSCQLKTYKLNNNTPDGEVQYTYCSDPDDPTAGETRESAEPSWSLSGSAVSVEGFMGRLNCCSQAEEIAEAGV